MIGSITHLNEAAKSFKRPNDNEKLFGESVDSTDAKQGSIGDCYFISALSILGNAKSDQSQQSKI